MKIIKMTLVNYNRLQNSANKILCASLPNTYLKIYC